MTENIEKDRAGMWAIVELFGHQRIAGFMSEQTIAGQGFVRVDVPALPASDEQFDPSVAAHTKMFGPGAIYAINPVDEAVATAAARSIRHTPIQAYGARDVLASMQPEARRQLLGAPEL